MATQEQLQQFGNTSSDSSSSDESSDELIPTTTAPKIKLKLKFRMSADDESKTIGGDKETAKNDDDNDDDDDVAVAVAIPEDDDDDIVEAEEVTDVVSPEPVEAAPVIIKSEETGDDDEVEVEAVVVKAMVVGDDEEEDETMVVAEPVVSSTTATTTSTTGGRTSHTKKRQSVRPIKMPAIASPGLLLANGNTTTAQFDHQMTLAGYTLETRKENPHRGSSTKRCVDDMFDSSVQLHRNFPRLVPPELIPDATEEDSSKPKLIQILNKGLTKAPNVNGNKRKRRFDEMIPLSLQIEYPSEFVKKRQEYVKKVKEREKAIIQAQEADLEDRPSVKVPPIPTPPSPPQLKENQQGFDLKDKHPFYPPKNDAFVKHLDPACFHASEGRYLALLSNSISDPHYVGAHAVGVSNLSVTAGTGLATTQTGSTSAGSASLASTVYGDRSSSKNNDAKSSSTSTSNGTASNGTASDKGKSKGTSSANGSSKTSKSKAASSSTSGTPGSKKKSSSPSPNPGSSADLKRIMEAETPETEDMRKCILRAGVYASRTGRHGQSFLGPDGNVYADVSKTFAAYAGVKPCPRCKNNKQGAYHCRLKRKHKDPDHDGGDSLSLLTPLFEEPLESLIMKAK